MIQQSYPWLLGAALAVLLAASAGAQGPIETLEHDLDSGPLDNPGGGFSMVFTAQVDVPHAPWLRLHFTDTVLPPGSQLILTSIADNATQFFEADSLQDYAHGSALFNGESILVQLLAGPGTLGNRVALDHVEYGSAEFSPEDSICPPGDTRQLSRDPRVARGYLSGCTMFLVNEHTFLAAGHCIGFDVLGVGPATNLAMFEVPLSAADGAWQFPSPDHQYPLDLSTLRVEDSAIGDWAVVSSLRNSNHGRYAGQSQQSWFEIGAVPETTFAEEEIRITGYGSVDIQRPIEWGWAQKTQVGPGVSAEATEIRYRTDTTPGNSGSPIILERTGDVIGIHTNGGCSGSPGWNSGTRIDAPGLLEAIDEVSNSRVAGAVTTIGQGCVGSIGAPTLSPSGIADVGEHVDITLAWAPREEVGVFALGFSGSQFFGLPLPLALDPFGLEGCTLYTSAEAQVPVFTGQGFLTLPLDIPNNPHLIGKDVYVQFIGLDAGAQNTLGAVSSNAARLHVGG